jgi:taurine dioxygenase
MTITVTPRPAALGADVSGIQLATTTDAELEVLQWALLEHHVIFFREQDLTDDTHIAFAHRWGASVPHPVTAHFGGEQTIGVVFNDEEHLPAEGEGWHTDHSWADYIPDAAILRSITTPPSGGDTVWCNAAAAYTSLPQATRSRIQHRTARHDPGPRFHEEMRRRMPDDMADAVAAAFPGNDYPIVTTHPITGRRGLFVSPGYTRWVNEMDGRESDLLLTELFDAIGDPANTCRFAWDDGSVAIWDEHATLHRGPNDFGTARRELRRYTVGATRPAASASASG